MLSLFTREKVLDLGSRAPSAGSVIKLAVFGTVKEGSDAPRKVKGDDGEDQVQIESRLMLYLDDHRLLLCQFPKVTSDQNEHDVQKFYIPTDPNKGEIISMCFNSTSTTLLALTSACYLYLIPLGFQTTEDAFNDTTRVILQEDARVLRCLSLRNPTSMVWWERPHSVQRSSVAIIGNTSSQLVFVDLNQEFEFKLFTFVSGIEHLQLYDEALSKTLLITCANKFQHYLVLDPSRAVLDPPPRVRRATSRSISTSSRASGASYLLNCVTNYAMLIDHDGDADQDPGGPGASVLDPDSPIRPQLISICEDPTSAAPSPSTTVTTSNQTEFLDLLEDCLKMSVHPQPHTQSIFVVKQNRPKYDFMGNHPNGSSSSGEDNSSVDSSSDLSGTFCSVSLNRDFSLDIHEYAAPEFCSRSIVLAGSKLFLVSCESVDQPKRHQKLKRSVSKNSTKNGDNHVSTNASRDQLVKILDCGHRFFLLVYPNRLILVSKYFAEQRNYLCATSPRSPLLLKKSDSLRSTGSGGSFRRKNYHHQGGSGSGGGGQSMCVIEDFKLWELEKSDLLDDEILNVFITTTPSSQDRSPDFTKISSANYPPPPVSSTSGASDLESILRVERAAIEAKLSPKLNEIIRIDERFLVVTKSRCFAIWSREKSFGEYFHAEICKQLDKVDSGPLGSTAPPEGGPVCEGDVITRAKYLVDCFVHRQTRSSPSIIVPPPSGITSASHPGQSWQFWLTRSALLLLQELSSTSEHAEPELTPDNLKRFNQIFRLFELARTPRRRVITALSYFRFWSRTLYYIRKFFETRILQELSEEERLFLAHQMMDCLLEKYCALLEKDCTNVAESCRKRALSDQYDHNNKSTSLDNEDNSFEKDFTLSPELFRKDPSSETSQEYLVSDNFVPSALSDEKCLPGDSSSATTPDKKSCRKETVRCTTKTFSKEAERELYQFFRAYRAYYDIEITLGRLLDRGLFEMARVVALIQADYLQLVQLVLRKFPNLEAEPKENRAKIMDLLTSTRVTYSLILSTRYLTSPDAVTSGCSIRLIQTYLDFVLKQLPNLSTGELFRLANVLQPNRFEMQLLMNNVLDTCNQTYLRGGSSFMTTSGGQVIETSLPIRKRDLLNLYMFVLILCLRKTHRKHHHHHHHHNNQQQQRKPTFSTRLYDWNFLNNLKSGFLNYPVNSETSRSSTNHVTPYRVSAGTFHSVALESPRSNQLYIWGRFPYVHLSQISPELSFGITTSIRHLRSPLGLNLWSQLLPGTAILDIACGHQHTLVLTDVGVFSFGSSTFGQLGLGPNVLESKFPITVESLQLGSGLKVVKICAGSYHSCAITEDGQLFTWGWGLHGQLGHGIIEDECVPRRVDAWKGQEVKIVDVAAGYAHTVVLTNSGDIYVFGENSYSQLGIDMADHIQPPGCGSGGPNKIKFSTPQKLTPNERLPGTVRLVACGLFHTVAVVTVDSANEDEHDLVDLGKKYEGGEKLFCWGLDPKTWRVKMRSDRQTTHQQMNGSNGARPTEPPTQISVYEYARIREISLEMLTGKRPKIVKVIAGQSHTVVLTQGGHCYSFGFGREGQLGLGSAQPSSPLVACPILELEAIVDIAAGAAHSLAVNSDGTVWGWGQNSDYQLDNSSSSVLDVGPAGGGNTTPNTSRRNSLLSSLMKRGDEQLMSRLMSLQKNVEWIPTRISVPLDPAGKEFSGPNPEPIKVPAGSRVLAQNSINRDMIKDLLMECLIRYKDFLDYKSLLKRFTHFDYPQLCAIVSYLMNDPIGTYSYQLSALAQEVQLELESILENAQDDAIPEALFTKWSNELIGLSVYFITESASKGRNHQLEMYKLIEALIRFWRKLDSRMLCEDIFTLKCVLHRLFLDSECKVNSPYFGLNLFRVIQDQEALLPDFRIIHKLDDQFMLKLLERTKVGITDNPSEIVQIQQLVEKLINVQEMYRCPKKTISTPSTSFPLELTWRKIMNQFSRSSQDGQVEQFETVIKSPEVLDGDDDGQDSDGEEINLRIPSDLDDSIEIENVDPEDLEQQKQNLLKSAILFVFACGHLLTRRQVVKALEASNHQQPDGVDVHPHEYYDLIKLVLENPHSALMQKLICPDCQMSES